MRETSSCELVWANEIISDFTTGMEDREGPNGCLDGSSAYFSRIQVRGATDLPEVQVQACPTSMLILAYG